MNWFVELTYADGTKENLYCTSRDEARRTRQRYIHWINPEAANPVTRITVRKVS